MLKKNMNKKILYLMGIDWYWIKQRPQILAEMLSRDYDITVAYYKEIIGKIELRKRHDELEKSIPVPVLPYRDKSKIIYLIQKSIFKYQVRNLDQYDIIWIGHPLLFRYIPKSYQGKIVYDCMDNHVALCKDLRIRRVISNVEEILIRRADLIIASSNRLKQGIETKYLKEVILVRNGHVAGQIRNQNIVFTGRNINIGYFGTIAEWIDFKIIINCLNKIGDMMCFFWGPVSVNDIPQHPRLLFEGIVEHNRLWDVAKNMDCLIMPFLVNDIIEDVDPVKLYEYISMGKIVIAPYYKEIARFAPYVYFYESEEELLNLFKQLQKGELKCKYTKLQQINFLENNTWEKRYTIIKENLSKFVWEN